MTISSTTRKAGPFAGNGVATAFPFDFKVFASSDVSIVRADSDGNETPLTLDSDYSITLNVDQNSNPGGSITYPRVGSLLPVLPAGSTLTAVGDLANLQPTDITNAGGFYPSTLEDAYDRAVILIQQLAEQQSRALTVPVSDADTSLTLPPAAQRANGGLGFDANGNPFIVQLTIGNVTAPVLNSIAMLRLMTVAVPTFVTGWRTARDGGGGFYQPLDPSDTRPDNGGTVIRTTSGIGFGLQLDGPVSIKKFGAYGDGIHSDDDAMARWLAALSPTLKGYVPAGTYIFTTPKTVAPTNNLSIQGDGSKQTGFMYTGAPTTGDLWTFGDGVTSVAGLNLSGFTVDSFTTMTAGTALRIKKHQNGGHLVRDVNVGSDARKLWDGVWFDNVNVFKYDGFDIRVQNEPLIVNGTATDDTGSDLWLDHGFVLGGTNQIHCGGGFGGLYLGQVLAYGGTVTSVLIDQARANRTNREIILSSECVLDGATQALLRVNNPGGIVILDCNAFLSGAGFFGGTTGDNIDIISMPLGRLTIGSSHIKSAKRHGISLGDSSTFWSVSDKTFITDCGGWGIYSASANSNGQVAGVIKFNTLGNIHPNVNAFVQTGTGIGATSGTITTSSGILRYRLDGGWCHTYSELTITNNGTGAGALLQTMPFPMKNNCVGYGLVTSNGKAVTVRGNATDGFNVTVLNYDGTYPGATGATIRTYLSYEMQT